MTYRSPFLTMEECFREMRESLTSRSFSGVRPMENVSFASAISRVAPPDFTMSLDTCEFRKKAEGMIPAVFAEGQASGPGEFDGRGVRPAGSYNHWRRKTLTSPSRGRYKKPPSPFLKRRTHARHDPDSRRPPGLRSGGA